MQSTGGTSSGSPISSQSGTTSFLGGSFDFSAFQGSSGNGGQGGLAPLDQVAAPASTLIGSSMMGAPISNGLLIV